MDLRNLTWSKQGNRRLLNEQFDLTCICQCLFKQKKCHNSKIKVLGRIGSPSTAAEVYRVQLTDPNDEKTIIAAKVMPGHDNAKEIRIAAMMGQYPGFLPILGATPCQGIKFDKHSKFTGVQQADILYSELAWGDVTQFKRYQNTLLWMSILIQVFQGIEAMQKRKVVHNDLHHGNVLINFIKNNAVIILIHDFGNSYIVKGKMTLDDRLCDTDKFLLTLGTLPLNKKIKDFLSRIEAKLELYEDKDNPSVSVIPAILKLFLV